MIYNNERIYDCCNDQDDGTLRRTTTTSRHLEEQEVELSGIIYEQRTTTKKKQQKTKELNLFLLLKSALLLLLLPRPGAEESSGVVPETQSRTRNGVAEPGRETRGAESERDPDKSCQKLINRIGKSLWFPNSTTPTYCNGYINTHNSLPNDNPR